MFDVTIKKKKKEVSVDNWREKAPRDNKDEQCLYQI